MAYFVDSMVSEEWRDILGLEGHYQVSSLGRVRGLDRLINCTRNGEPSTRFQAGCVLKEEFRGGYKSVSLKIDGKNKKFLVHRLVCEAWHGRPFPNAVTAHGDGTKTNNKPENLRWATPSENQADRLLHGTAYNRDSCRSAKFSESQKIEIIELLTLESSNIKIANMYGLKPSTVKRIRWLRKKRISPWQ